MSISPFRLSLLLSLLLVASAPLVAGDVEGLLERADHQFERGKYAKALRTLREAQALDGTSPEVTGNLTKALYAHARDLFENGEPSGEARALLEEMLELTDDPSARVAAFKLLGSVHYSDEKLSEAERLDRAEEAYGQALQLAGGDDWAARLSLAVLLRDRGLPQEALGQLRAVEVGSLEKEPRVVARSLICALKPLVGGEEAKPSGEETERIGDNVMKPEKLFAPAPQYSTALRRAGVSGAVTFQGMIDRDGCVVNLKLLNEAPEALVPLVRDAVSRWLFDPALKDGEPVPVSYNLTINMKLTGPVGVPAPIHIGPWH